MKKTVCNLKKVLVFLNISKKSVLLLIFLGVVTSLASSFLPTINGLIVNNILKLSYSKIILLATIGGLIQIINTLFTYLMNRKYFIIRKDFIVRIRKKLCFSLINYKSDVYDNEGTGVLLNKVKNDSRLIANFLNDIKDGLIGLILNLTVILYIFYLNYYIGFYYLIVIFFSILIRYFGVKKSLKYQKISIMESDLNDNNLSEIINGEKDIKINNLKDKLLKKNSLELNKVSYNLFKSNSKSELYISIAKLIESIFSGFMVIFSVFLIKNNLLSVGNFIIIFMYKGSVFLFPSRFGVLISSLGKFNISCDRVFSVIDNSLESYGHTDTTIYGDIEFKDVCFHYENGNKIFDKLNLKIKKNSYCVLLGRNGSGKTTILNLIAKILDPVSGKIFIDNYDINDLSENTLRCNIAYISQQPYLFNFSILDNLLLVNDDRNKIIEVCKLTGIHDKIMSFNNGYDTIIGTDACKLSGGEKQKLAIARALLTGAKILLFDEITNNLDKESIDSIEKIIDLLKGKYTIIMITHGRVLSSPDNVFKINNYKLVEDKGIDFKGQT